MSTPSPETLTEVFLWLAVLAGLLVLATVVVQRFRGGAARAQHTDSQLVAKFREMHSEGDISEAEYRTIKSVLGDHLQRDVKRGKDKA
jgi:uncharacterized membrane protein